MDVEYRILIQLNKSGFLQNLYLLKVYTSRKSASGNEMVIPSRKIIICLLGISLMVLHGCASKGNSTSETMVGLHIDAVLELVVEYPLKWGKDRRLEFGRSEGEIRWSHPEQNETLLRVTSRLREHHSDEQELDLALIEYPGLTETRRERVELPAGAAWHVSGQAGQKKIELYQILKSGRAYAIVLQSSTEDFDEHEKLMEEITVSFLVLTQ